MKRLDLLLACIRWRSDLVLCASSDSALCFYVFSVSSRPVVMGKDCTLLYMDLKWMETALKECKKNTHYNSIMEYQWLLKRWCYQVTKKENKHFTIPVDNLKRNTMNDGQHAGGLSKKGAPPFWGWKLTNCLSSKTSHLCRHFWKYFHCDFISTVVICHFHILV